MCISLIISFHHIWIKGIQTLRLLLRAPQSWAGRNVHLSATAERPVAPAVSAIKGAGEAGDFSPLAGDHPALTRNNQGNV
jgi:hypothetical protein